MKSELFRIVALAAASIAITNPSHAAEASFTYKVSYRNVAADPDGIWTGEALSGGPVTIHEYQLHTPSGELLISQIWNDDCATATCPTRLLRLEPGGRRTVLVDDMMRQIIPPNDPRFAGLPANGPQAEFARNPFRLSDDGKTLLNGDFRFDIDEGKR
jgi:hypothetical protein